MSRRNDVEMAEMAILAAYVLESSDDDDFEETTRRKRSVWRKNWLGHRDEHGFCAKLLPELREEEPELFRNFVRMTTDQFDHLLRLVKPHIEKTDTNMRASISAEARLVLTLRYLATGECFNSLRFLFRISQPAVSCIIPDVLDAIYKALVANFIKVWYSELQS